MSGRPRLDFFSDRLNNSFSHSSAVGVWPDQLTLKVLVAAGQDILCTPSMTEETWLERRVDRSRGERQTDKVTEDTKL